MESGHRPRPRAHRDQGRPLGFDLHAAPRRQPPGGRPAGHRLGEWTLFFATGARTDSESHRRRAAMILALLLAMAAPSDEFFIISSVDMARSRLVLKRPTEVTVLAMVSERT